jgi:hypothetical protein
MAPNRIVILRHGEKLGDPAAPDDPTDPNLSPAGVERANMLVALIPSKFGNPNFLAAAENSNKSHRPVETLQPLANKLHFLADKFIQTYPNDSYAALAADLRAKPKYSSTLVIVCWHHGNIPQLALTLGATPTQLATAPEMSRGKWNPLVFDRFWVLDFGSEGVSFQSVPQVL